MHKEDILETALNNGVKYTADKYSIAKSEVIDIVDAFQEEMKGECRCDKLRDHVVFIHCLMCTANNYHRLKPRWEES